jgi:hypothetical protein
VKQRKIAVTKCYELLSLINREGKASKWDLLKLLGTEEAFRKWIDKDLEVHKIVIKIKEGRVTYYRKSENGETLHHTLQNHHVLCVLRSILSGKKLKLIF